MKRGKKVTGNNLTFGIVGLSAAESVWFPDVYQKGKKALEDRGIKVVEGSTIHSSYHYLAEKPENIAKSLHEMFLRPDVDAVMCAGGGICMNKALPHVDFDLLKENWKPFIGISNVVVLMSALLQNGMASFHGPFSMWNYGVDGTPTSFTHENVIKMLSGYKGKLPSMSEWHSFRDGNAEGVLFGGNITSLGTVVGTKYCPVELFESKILLLEDIAEKYDRLDSIITHMDLMGVFERIKGVVIGKLEECEPPENVDMTVTDFLEMIFSKYNFPVIYDCDFGHIADNLCLPVGSRVRMIAKDRPEIEVLEPGVE